MLDFIPYYFAGGVVVALAFVMAEWRHRRTRAYWECALIAFSVWPAVVVVVVVDWIQKRRRQKVSDAKRRI